MQPLEEMLNQINQLTENLEQMVKAQAWEQIPDVQHTREQCLTELNAQLSGLNEVQQRTVFDCLTQVRQRDQAMMAQIKQGMSELNAESKTLQKGKRMQKAYGAFK